MENKDILDIHIPIGGDIKDFVPLYVGRGLCGQAIHLNRTEVVEGLNPSRLISLESLLNLIPSGQGSQPYFLASCSSAILV
jgi:hypothetical protein